MNPVDLLVWGAFGALAAIILSIGVGVATVIVKAAINSKPKR